MATISILLKMVITNMVYIIPVVLIFLGITLVGTIYIVSLKGERKWYLVLPEGAITGLLSFILLLGTLSYILKGRFGIAVIFLVFILSGLLLFKRNREYFPKIRFEPTWKNVTIALTYLAIAGFLFFLVGANIYGGDVIAYWGLATSFANGNYPLHSPWQPDLLPVHHQGTYLAEGAIHALSGADMQLVHTMYSYFVVISGLFLVWGWTRKHTNFSFLSLIPALFTFFAFGGMFYPLPNYAKNYIRAEVDHVTGRLPLLLDAKNRLGGASNLPEVIYINHRAASLVGTIFILIFICSKLKISLRIKASIVAAFSVVVSSSDEAYLPVLGFAGIIWFIYEFFKYKGKARKMKVFRDFCIAAIFATILFLLVGSALRDSLFVASSEAPRFQLDFSYSSIAARINGLRSAFLSINAQSKYFWLLPDLRIIIIFAFLISWLSKPFWAKFVSLSTLGALIAYLTVSHTFYPNNQDRFLHILYFVYGGVITYSLLKLIQVRKGFLKIFSVILLVSFLPSILFSTRYLYTLAKKDYYPNFKGSLPDYDVLKWARKKIPRGRIFFIDGYLNGVSYSYLTLNGIQNYGLFVPVSPARIKVHTPDYGIEAVDTINTLNPSSMGALKIDYLFIVNGQETKYPIERRRDIENNIYFRKIYEDKLGKLYEVDKQYYDNANDLPGAISQLPGLVKEGSNIYFDSHPRLHFGYRTVLVLSLKDKNNIYTVWGPGLFNYIETKIVVKTPDDSIKYDYLVLGLVTNPMEICNCKKVNLIWENVFAKVYESE